MVEHSFELMRKPLPTPTPSRPPRGPTPPNAVVPEAAVCKMLAIETLDFANLPVWFHKHLGANRSLTARRTTFGEQSVHVHVGTACSRSKTHVTDNLGCRVFEKSHQCDRTHHIPEKLTAPTATSHPQHRTAISPEIVKQGPGNIG